MYFIATSYDGIAYFTPPLGMPVVSGGDADLLVYDTTSGPVPVSVRGRHVIVTAPDTGKGRAVLEVFELSPTTHRSRAWLVRRKSRRSRRRSPMGATNAIATDGDIPAEAVKFVNGRVQVFSPIAPGESNSFHFTTAFR